MEIKEALKQREEMLAVSNFFFCFNGFFDWYISQVAVEWRMWGMDNVIPYPSFSPEEMLMFQAKQVQSWLMQTVAFLSIILFFLSIAFCTAVCGDREENNRTG